MKKYIIAIISCISFVFTTNGQETKNVLFLGNSYTQTHNVPNTTRLLAQSNGDILTYDSNTPGGHRLTQHATNTTSISKIQNTNWDHVILQDQSLTPAYFYLNFYRGSEQLTEIINEDSPCTNKTILFMTWGRQNHSSYPYAEMQQLTTDNYNNVATIFGTEVSPVGVAWKKVRDDGDPINLYSADGSHQSFAGTYLAACVFYATIFDKSPVGLSYHGSLSQDDALYLQQKAFEAYNEYVALGLIHTGNSTDTITDAFTATINNTEAELNNLIESCSLQTSFDFKYTGVSTQSQINTTLQYIIYQNGNQIKEENVPISMSISPNICVNETSNYPLNIDLTSVEIGTFHMDILLNGNLIAFYTLESTEDCTGLSISDVNSKDNIALFPNPVYNILNIDLGTHHKEISTLIFNTNGEIVAKTNSTDTDKIQLKTDNLSSGIYFVKVTFDNHQVIVKKIIKE